MGLEANVALYRPRYKVVRGGPFGTSSFGAGDIAMIES